MKARYVLLFQVKRSPFPTAPSYVYRYEHERHLKHVALLPDADVDDDDMAAMQAVQETLLSNGGEEALYTDAELARTSEYDCNGGFFVGVSRRAVRVAFERDGFTVIENDRPQWRIFHGTAPMRSAADIAELTRQLSLCSLPSLLGEGERQFHAEAVGAAVRNTLPRKQRWLVEQVRQASAGWTRPMNDCFHLITAALEVREPFAGVLPKVSNREVSQLVGVRLPAPN